MKFALIDKVLELEVGKRIVAAKNVALAEEYLQDHFPAFPVLPGVFMVQAMVEAATWLVRASQGFDPARSLVTLAELRNVKYQSFISPGQQLVVELVAEQIEPEQSRFKGVGRVGEKVVVQGRLTLRHGPTGEAASELDERIVQRLGRHWELIKPSEQR